MAGTPPRLPGIVKYTTYEGQTRLDPYIPESWGNNDHQHYRIYDWTALNQYFQQGKSIPSRYKWAEFHVKVPSPFDNLMNEWFLDQFVKMFSGHVDIQPFPGLPSLPLSTPGLGCGRAIRATMWWKGGFPLFEYTIFLEYDDGSGIGSVTPPEDIYQIVSPVGVAPILPGVIPVVTTGAIVALAVLIFGIIIGLKVMGFDSGSVTALAQSPFTGMTGVFVIGIAFILVLSWVQPRLTASVVQPKPPGIVGEMTPSLGVGIGGERATPPRPRRR
jgi:hypothetical protein